MGPEHRAVCSRGSDRECFRSKDDLLAESGASEETNGACFQRWPLGWRCHVRHATFTQSSTPEASTREAKVQAGELYHRPPACAHAAWRSLSQSRYIGDAGGHATLGGLGVIGDNLINLRLALADSVSV